MKATAIPAADPAARAWPADSHLDQEDAGRRTR